jgi:8-amino-7-oxononanoate synthase
VTNRIGTYKKFKDKLIGRSVNHRLRTLKPVTYQIGKDKAVIDHRELLNLCSNDYLGLSAHPELIERSNHYTFLYGTGSSASRLVSGSLQIHHELEEKIAGLYGAESALLFGNGFIANSTLLPALTERGDLILADKQCHNSIIHGGIASRAEFRRYRHNDLDHLEEQLKKHKKEKDQSCWVVTESLFSMSGDLAPLDEISKLCKEYNSFLMVDDAHAFGVFGENGLGLTEGRDDIDLILGTMGKAGGSYGAFVLSNTLLRDYLVNFCTGLIYTTSPAPGMVGAMDAAFDLIPVMKAERETLFENIGYMIDRLKNLEIETGENRSQIIPVYTADEKHAIDVSGRLYEESIFVQAIRPPTVNRSLVRISLSALHSKSDINRFTEGLRNAW